MCWQKMRPRFLFRLFNGRMLENNKPQNGALLSNDTLIAALKSIRNYLIRRRVLRLSQGENKNILPLINKIEHLANHTTTMDDLLANMFYKARFPNDTEMQNRVETVDFL